MRNATYIHKKTVDSNHSIDELKIPHAKKKRYVTIDEHEMPGGIRVSDETVANKKKLARLMARCFRENKEMNNDMKEVDCDLLMYNLQQNTFEEIIDRLKDIEYANPNVLKQLYRYKQYTEEILEIEEKKEIEDFREGILDPINMMKKQRKGRKGTIKNKISDDLISKMQ
jgi:hypothetical protein